MCGGTLDIQSYQSHIDDLKNWHQNVFLIGRLD